jgi:hypothetical protein
MMKQDKILVLYSGKYNIYVRSEVLMVLTMKPTLKKEAAGSFETMVCIHKITQC